MLVLGHEFAECGPNSTVAHMNNTFTVSDEGFADLIGAVDALGGMDAKWVIYRIAGMNPASDVGAEDTL